MSTEETDWSKWFPEGEKNGPPPFLDAPLSHVEFPPIRTTRICGNTVHNPCRKSYFITDLTWKFSSEFTLLLQSVVGPPLSGISRIRIWQRSESTRRLRNRSKFPMDASKAVAPLLRGFKIWCPQKLWFFLPLHFLHIYNWFIQWTFSLAFLLFCDPPPPRVRTSYLDALPNPPILLHFDVMFLLFRVPL